MINLLNLIFSPKYVLKEYMPYAENENTIGKSGVKYRGKPRVAEPIIKYWIIKNNNNINTFLFALIAVKIPTIKNIKSNILSFST